MNTSYPLLDYGIQEAIQTIMHDLQRNETSEKRATLAWPILEYVRTHQRLFSLLLLKNSTESFSTLLLRHLVADIEGQLARSEKAVKHMGIPTTILAQFYAGAVLQVITWWVEQEMRVPSKELADYIQRLLLPLSEEEEEKRHNRSRDRQLHQRGCVGATFRQLPQAVSMIDVDS